MSRLVRTIGATLVVLGVVAHTSSDAIALEPPPELEVILAIDTSESMEPAIETAKASARAFVASMPADVPIGLETFDDVVTVLTPPTTDRAVLGAQLDSITTRGDTALYDVVVTASQHFAPTTRHKVLVILSDGKDDGSTNTLDGAIAAAQGMHVEAISLTTADTDLAALRALGPVTPADDATGVAQAFQRVSGLIVEVIASVTTTPPPTTTPATTTPATTPATSAPPTTAPTDTSVAAGSMTSEPAPPAASSNVWLWAGAGALFVGLFALVLLVYPRERVSRERLGVKKPRSVADIGNRAVSAVDEALERRGRRSDLARALAVADIGLKPADFVAMVGVVAIVAGLVGVLLGGPVLGLVVAGAVALGTRVYVSRKRAKRQAAFADQLPDVLQLVTTALRSGFGLTQALESVADEADEPARSEFAQVLLEARMGRDLSSALHALAERMDSTDLEWVVSAIDINRDTGGNLTEILHHVGVTIRERARIDRQVRTLTAEGRMSARLLTGLPFVMLLWQWRVNPENFELLTEGVGLVALAFGGVLLVVGTLWVRRIVNSVAL